MRDIYYDQCSILLANGTARLIQDATVTITEDRCAVVGVKNIRGFSTPRGSESFLCIGTVLESLTPYELIVNGKTGVGDQLVPCRIVATYRLNPHREPSCL